MLSDNDDGLKKQVDTFSTEAECLASSEPHTALTYAVLALVGEARRVNNNLRSIDLDLMGLNQG